MDTYFAMARGYQGENGDVKALAMKKWFHTNYHYIVPELDDEAEIRLCGTKAFDEYLEAKELGIEKQSLLSWVLYFAEGIKILREQEKKM